MKLIMGRWESIFLSYHPPGKQVAIRSRTSFADSSGRTQSMDGTAHSSKRFYQWKKQLLSVQNKMYNPPKMNYLHLDFKIRKNIVMSQMLFCFKLSLLLANNNTFFIRKQHNNTTNDQWNK